MSSCRRAFLPTKEMTSLHLAKNCVAIFIDHACFAPMSHKLYELCIDDISSSVCMSRNWFIDRSGHLSCGRGFIRNIALNIELQSASRRVRESDFGPPAPSMRPFFLSHKNTIAEIFSSLPRCAFSKICLSIQRRGLYLRRRQGVNESGK